jgi:predicted AAA+ superfamily ATPase
MERSRILLGCLQPGQTSSTYSDALNRLVDQLHYLNSSGDKTQETTRYWFDIRANLRREMEERKKRFNDKTDVRARMADVAKTLAAGATFFDGVHIFTPHSDVPDDSSLRLVMMAPEHFYSKEESRLAFDAVLDYARNNGTKPRYRGNRLLFVAPDQATHTRLCDCIRIALAWESIVKDVSENRLVLDNLQADQAKKEMSSAVEVLPRVARECFKWLLCPTQDTPTEKLKVEAFPLNTSGSALGPEIERVCIDNELVISTWSPVHLRNKLKELYWKPEKVAVKAMDYWEDSLRYPYLSRLKDRSTLAQAIVKGAATRDFFGTAYGQTGDKYEGFKFGEANVQLDDTLLLIEPTAAAAYEAAHAAPKQSVVPEESSSIIVQEVPHATGNPVSQPTSQGPTLAAKAKSFHGSATVAPAAAKMRLVQIAEEIIATLTADPNAEVKVRIEIEATFANGAQDQIKRTISENAKTLGFGTAEWE